MKLFKCLLFCCSLCFASFVLSEEEVPVTEEVTAEVEPVMEEVAAEAESAMEEKVEEVVVETAESS